MSLPIINVTKNALNKMAKISQYMPTPLGFLFHITSGGCNGFNYKLEVLDQTTKTEIMDSKPTILTHKDIQLYVDPVSEFYVLGTSIDYISGNYEKGIFESMFISRSVQTMRQVVGVGVSFTSNKC